jgi:hypothetical protein
MGSKRDLRWAIVHDGEIRRSDEEFGELIMRGTSAALCRDMLASEGCCGGLWKDEAVGASANRAIWQNKVVSQTLVWCWGLGRRLQKWQVRCTHLRT